MSNVFDLIWTGPDVNKLEANVVETEDNVGSIKGFITNYNKKKTFRCSCEIFIYSNLEQLGKNQKSCFSLILYEEVNGNLTLVS